MQVRVCPGVGDLVFVPPGAEVSAVEQTCSRIYVDKTVPDFVRYADLV